jgi:hypothetical protein
LSAAEMSPLDLLTDMLACHRLTRLVVDDAIFDGPRHKVKQAAHEAGWPKLVELASCRWCISVYVGFGVVAARQVAPRAWTPVARALACSSVAGLLSTVG